ncbi:MAG: hypothetical protein FGM46_04585 [Ferruginibacter sp.]|nr:hypothetical protein [Ferruginibacter sp.]
MINGFVIDIINENPEAIFLPLFTDKGLPGGVTITAKHSGYDYNALFLMAMTEGFTGSGISTDDERIGQVTIYEAGKPNNYEFYKLLENRKIRIDGVSCYVTLIIPPSSEITAQLMPVV